VSVLELPLRRPEHRVSPRAVPFWTVGALIGVAFLVVPQLIALTAGGPPWLGSSAVVTAVLGIGYALLMPRVRYRIHRWEVTDAAVYTLTGWLSQHWRIAPISRIQTVDTERGPLQQLFRLATVTVTTASARGPVKIAELDAEQASKLARTLTERTQATSGDAT
jgi:membrane protein YdbS with pleckstrin-like domain